MTVAELISRLERLDQSLLVTIDTSGFARGLYPAADSCEEFTCGKAFGDDKQPAIVLQPRDW